MKSVLISIQPKWVEKICHEIGKEKGKPIYEKVVEVRKTRPKLETPFKCYIYCTINKRGEDVLLVDTKGENVQFGDYRNAFTCNVDGNVYCHICNGKVIGEFVCDKIYNLFPFGMGTGIELLDELVSPEMFCKESCLTEQEICDYIGEKDGYGWHISDLKIYDKPKELSEFKSVKVIRRYHKKEYDKYEKLSHSRRVEVKHFERPPQSWCYVEGGIS